MSAKPHSGARAVHVSLLLVVVMLALLVFSSAAPVAHAAQLADASLEGTVTAAGTPLGIVPVELFVANRTGGSLLGDTMTDAEGKFKLSYTPPSAGVLYVRVRGGPDPEASHLHLLSVVGALGNGGAIAPWTYNNVTVNELTTVATTYAFAQFLNDSTIVGTSPGLENAAATVANLADPVTGAAGSVLTGANNGANNDTYATFNTLANLVSLCAGAVANDACTQFLQLATAPGGSAPTNTVEAVVNIAKNPTVALGDLTTLAQAVTLYTPALAVAPNSWVLALLYTDDGLYASGRIALDPRGNVWSSNNWQPGTLDGSTVITVLDPTGKPIFGSPISGGGMQGGAWGAAIAQDGNAWFGSFGGNTINKYAPDGTPLSPDTGWTEGGILKPQGIAVDQRGNIWIANNEGKAEPQGVGSVTVYPGGDPTQAFEITGGGISHPFAVQINDAGRAWVTNAGVGAPAPQEGPLETKGDIAGGTVTVIGPDFQPTAFSPIDPGTLQWPLGLALDSKGNAWVASFFNNTVVEIQPDGTVARSIQFPIPGTVWGIAVDGSDRVWVAGFADPMVWLLCGENTAACPPGSATGDIISPAGGFRSQAIQHLTSLQVDASGNLWLSNNWSQLDPPAGGVGIVEFIGIAPPVCTPLLGLPAVPSTATETPCGSIEAVVVPVTGASAPDMAYQLWLGGIGLVLMLGGLWLLLRSKARLMH